MKELLDAILHDNLVTLKKLLAANSVDLSQEVEADYGHDVEDPDFVPVVFYAIYVGASIEAIEMLFENGVDVAYANNDGVGAIDVAIKHKRQDIVGFCINAGVDPTLSRRKSGITPLILAASFNDVAMLKYLLSKGCSIDEKDNYGQGAIEYAKKMDQKAVIKYIENMGT